jgi:hypothetical protein
MGREAKIKAGRKVANDLLRTRGWSIDVDAVALRRPRDVRRAFASALGRGAILAPADPPHPQGNRAWRRRRWPPAPRGFPPHDTLDRRW